MQRTFSAFAAVVTVLATVTIAPVAAAPAAPVAAPTLGSQDSDLPQASPGTGILPNFAAEGDNLVRLQVGAFDPLTQREPTQAGIPVLDAAVVPSDAEAYWLVQVAGGDFAGALTALEASGTTVAGWLPENTYIVRATPAQLDAVEVSDAIRWVGIYQPAYKLPVSVPGRDGILDLQGTQRFRVYGFRGAPDASLLATNLAAIPGVEIDSDATDVVDVVAPAAALPAIAAVTQAAWIAVTPIAVPLNAQARWVNDTGVRDVYDATSRLTGAGQVASAADSGLNYTIDLNGQAHIDFRDCDPYPTNCKMAQYTQVAPGDTPAAIDAVQANGTGHRKMVAFFDLGGSGPSPHDDSGHGSHVSGSITADTNGDGLPDGHDGMAPGAGYVFQSVGDPGGGLGGLPTDNYDLYRQAYRPSNPAGVPETYNATDYANYVATRDARTHNYSIGLIVPTVDAGDAAVLDQFAWDHEDFVMVVSAGNNGPDPSSMGAPSVAKNNLSSAASANGRQPMASMDSLASFSSHGPTGDGRIGPDLATPGQTIISTKGGSADEHHYLQGTSMSAPILTGLATLVRQYFWDGYGPATGKGFAGGDPAAGRRHNPSSALVRATLVNGAERMRGAYTGDDGTQATTDGQWPSWGQGFGLVNLSNSLHFTGDTTNNWFHDVWRGDSDAFTPTNASNPTPVTRSYSFDVAAGQPFDATLSWTDAPTALIAGTPALVNDLNLRVIGPEGEVYVGNNFNSRANPTVDVAETPEGEFAPDAKNPTERIRIADPAPGTYTIEVTAARIQAQSPGTPGGRQGFALAASGNIAPAGTTFTPGPELQVDAPGAPTIDPGSVVVENVSTDTTIVRFSTDEPTTASVTVDGQTFHDVYNRAPGDGFTDTYDAGTIETSDQYAGLPVVGTEHEVLVFGLDAGAAVTLELGAVDLNDEAASSVDVPFENTALAIQAQASDMALLAAQAGPGGWRTSTQLYVGNNAGTPLLGAFGFGLPAGVDPADITGAAIELTGMHDLSPAYDADPTLRVELLGDDADALWGNHTYETITSFDPAATVAPHTKNIEGGQRVHAFTFQCNDLDDLKEVLADGFAGFTIQSEVEAATSLPSYEFGFNRRSRGPQFRPRLVLFTAESPANTTVPCDPATPAPTISEVRISPGVPSTTSTVYWTTDVASDSTVIFREKGTTDWIQVGTPALTELHQVGLQGLDPTKEYEFGIRSAACNGAATTADNAGAGWGLFRPPPVEVTYYMTGQPSDEAAKHADAPTATFSQVPPSGEPPIVQNASPFATGIAANPLAAYWISTDFPEGPIDQEIELTTYWSSEGAGVLGLASEIRIFTNVNPANNSGMLLYSTESGAMEAAETPVPSTNRIRLQGTIINNLLIQMQPFYTAPTVRTHYGAASTPARFGWRESDPTAGLPLVGTVPPPSAESNVDIASVPLRRLSSPADMAAGTGAGCVEPLNVGPVAVDDVASTGVDEATTVTVLANDTDPDGDSLTVTDVSATAEGGTVTIAVDGQSVDYTPPSGFAGVDTFTYTIEDGNDGSDTATVTVYVSDGPVVESVSPECVVGGEQLVIRGFGFGAPQGSSYPVLGGRGLSNVTSWSATEVVVPVPASRTSGYAGVVVEGITSNGIWVQVVPGDDPDATGLHLDAISPNNGPAGTEVTFTGTGFGDAYGCGEAVAFAGVLIDRSNVVSWSDTQVVARAPEGVTDGFAGIVTNNVTSNGIYYTVGAPLHVDSAAPNPVVGGADLTITGTGFGASQGDSVPVLANQDLLDVVSWTDTEVVVTVPVGHPSGYAGVRVNGLTSNGVYVTVNNGADPQVDTMTPDSGPIGTEVTFTGTDFGDGAGAHDRVVFRDAEGNPLSATIVTWTDTQVVAQVPAGAVSGYAGVVRNGNVSNGLYFTVTSAT